MVRDLKFSLCCFCLFLKNHGIYSFGCSATSLADFRESSVMFCKLLNIPSQSLSTEVVYRYDALNLLSYMTLNMKKIKFIFLHHKDKLFAVRKLGNAAKEGLKRTTRWTACYFTNPNSSYPVPDSAIILSAIAAIQPLPPVPMAPQSIQKMRDWV